MANADDREEGEIEDGEIIESGEEGGFDPENEKCDNNNGAHSMMELLYMEMEGKDELNVKKRKKKRKRKKKAYSSNDKEINPPKLKKPRYVDHDRIVDKTDNSWHKSFPTSPPHLPVPHPVPPTEDGRRFYNNWSPDRLSPDENNLRRPRDKSPPGLYDSPYESEDDLGDVSVGKFDREFIGGSGRPGGNRKSRKRKMRAEKRGVKRRDESDNRRRNQRPPTTDTQHLICKFYLEGKCVKGDGCNYSHDISNKKMELCKFYLNGFCSKIESCIYLHNEFPCKFFHTGAQCYSAENCKFSHDPLSDAMRKALDNHLAKDNKLVSSPRSDGECSIQPRPHRPSLLGSPPQHIKDMVMRKKIPSLFDLEIKPPVYQSGVGTSMPPAHQGSQNQQGPSNNSSAVPGPLLPTPKPNFRDDGHRTPLLPLPPASSFEPDSQDYYNFDQDLRVPFNSMDSMYPNGLQSSFNPPKRYFGSDSMMDVDERYPPNGPNNNDPDNLFVKNNFDEDERVHEVIKNHEHGIASEKQPFNPIPWRNLAVLDVDMRAGLNDDENSDSSSGNIRDFYSKFGKTNDSNEELFGIGLDTSLSSESEDENKRSLKENLRSSNVVPLHLPKKQRELFMRIQQREAANKTVSDSDDSKKAEDCSGNENGLSNPPYDPNPIPTEIDEEVEKEKWYSSSEDDDDDNDQPLAAMLKKLQQQPIGKTSSSGTVASLPSALPSSSSTSSVAVNDSSMLQLSKILQSITNKPSASTPASKPAVKVDPRRDPRRDPRSTRTAAVPSHPPPTVNTTSISSTLSSVPSELRDPRSKHHKPPVTQPPLPVQPSQPSYAVSSNVVSYGDNSPSSQISSRLEETNPQPVKSSLSRLPEHSKPKPIISRKRSSVSEEEIVESHSKSSSHHLFPYKLQTVSASVPNYSGVVHSVNKNVDPKLLLSDPRLKKELANEFSVLSGINEESSTSSSSLKKNEVSEPQNGNSHSLPTTSSKVRVGQHRLGVATMPAPRMKIQSSQLKKPVSSMLITPLSLLREPPERSTTPPSILFGSRLKEPSVLGANFKVEKDCNPNKNTPSEEETVVKASEKESEVKSEKINEITSILSPNAETVSNKFEDQVIIEPDSVDESDKAEDLNENKTDCPSVNTIVANTAVSVSEVKVESKTEMSDSKMFDRMNNFDMDDSENEKSDSDLVIVEPEVEKVKKVKKNKVTKKSATKSTSASTVDKNKKANVLVAQLVDGSCIKIKIKPTPAATEVNAAIDIKKKETARTPLKSKSTSSSSSSENGKRTTRNTKLSSLSSFENALNSGSSPEHKSSKKTKKPQKEKEVDKDKEKSCKKESTSKSKSKKSKKQENGDISVAEAKTD